MTGNGIHEQQNTLSRLKDMLANIHAMCIHQISGLLDDHKEALPEMRYNSAQSYQQYFLKVGLPLSCSSRILILTIADDEKALSRSYALLNDKDPDSGDWERWQLAETLRRTVHLVNIVNKLSCYVPKANSQFYELLDDKLILDLQLPAPDALWTATSSASFKNVQSQISHQGLSPRNLLESPNSMDQTLAYSEKKKDWLCCASTLILPIIDQIKYSGPIVEIIK
jgi:hypothetical protein